MSEYYKRLYIFGARWLIFILIILAVVVEPALWFFIVVSALVTWCLAAILQKLFHRQRPYLARKQTPLINLWIPSSSFPSAHSAISFAVATMVVSENIEFGLVLLVLALLVALSRVGVRVHYFTDIIAGAVLGILTALAVKEVLIVMLGILLF
ncbi:MAG: phosphatase PAP2 family protein [Candidatus Uhrbacteria bacterium]